MDTAVAPTSFTLPASTALPVERVYVLKLVAGPLGQALCGRVEHLLSGRQHDFANLPELLAALHEGAAQPGPACP